MAAVPSLSDRLRDATQADPDALERAVASKTGLAERMVDDDAREDAHPEVAEATRALAERMEALAAERAVEVAAQNGTTESGVQEAPPFLERVKWFFTGKPPADESDAAITPLPEPPEGWELEEEIPLDPPYVYVRILRSIETGERLYKVLEPPLDDREQEVLAFVTDALVRSLNVDPTDLDEVDRGAYLDQILDRVMTDYRVRLNSLGRKRIAYYVRRDFLGLGPIEPLMQDPNIEDISCDGAAEPVFVYHRAMETVPTSVRFPSQHVLDGFVIRLAQRSGKAISIGDPILDAALPDGSRLQATLGQEVTQNGSTFTIRRFRAEPFTPLDLVRFGTADLDLLTWFWLVVQNGQSMIMSGGTASGKTTLLNAMGQFIPPLAKIVTIEDTREVNLAHHNWIKAVTRSGSSAEGTGEIGMFELLKAALRQRPEYILVGEVRGIEATVAFQAMATGHTVYSTLHADSARSVVYRLENDPINIPRLVLQALDVIVIMGQVRLKGKRVRRIREVVELVGMDPVTKELLTNTVYKWDPDHDRYHFNGRSYLLERLAAERSWTAGEMQKEMARRRRVLQRMLERGVNSVDDFTALMRAYYRNPDQTLDVLEETDG